MLLLYWSVLFIEIQYINISLENIYYSLINITIKSLGTLCLVLRFIIGTFFM